jgi:hypothetical protein
MFAMNINVHGEMTVDGWLAFIRQDRENIEKTN